MSTNGFDLVNADLVGDHLKFAKVQWFRAGRPADPAERLAALLDTASAGSILWEDGKLADLQSDLIINSGVPEVMDGYSPYTSLMMVDEGGKSNGDCYVRL